MSKPRDPDGTLVSKIPEIMAGLSLRPMDLVRRNISLTVAYRAAAGELTFHVNTLAKLADALGVGNPLSLVEYIPAQSEKDAQAGVPAAVEVS